MRPLSVVVVLLGCLGRNERSNAVPQWTDAAGYSRQQQIAVDRTINSLGIPRLQFDITRDRNGLQYTSNLDSLRSLYVLLRHIALRSTAQDLDRLHRHKREQGAMQALVARSVRFPCDVRHGRSPTPPTDVAALRPGDIDVIAAIGDSISAGTGLVSEGLMDMLTEHRSLTFSGGGRDTWRAFLTLPNILKEFNPQLYGYATDNGIAADRTSHLNVAEPMVQSRDLVFQARVLIERLRRDPLVDMARHWKLLTIFVGSNDFCSDMCHHDDPQQFLRRHERDLRRMLTLLRDNVPRLLINLLPVPNLVNVLHQMQQVPFVCEASTRFVCHCIFNAHVDGAQLGRIEELLRGWQHIDRRVAALPEYRTQDFAVVYQAFLANVSMPLLANGYSDLRYFSSDCFHFSQLGHAVLSNAIWNNMMLPAGHKQLHIEPLFRRFECPTREHPYISTEP